MQSLSGMYAEQHRNLISLQVGAIMLIEKDQKGAATTTPTTKETTINYTHSLVISVLAYGKTEHNQAFDNGFGIVGSV